MSTGLTTGSQKRRSAIGFGIFTAVALLLLVWIITQVERLASVSDGYHVVAYYDDVALLKVNDPVRVAGVTVGAVTDYKLDQPKGNKIRVDMVIRDDIKIPVDSRAEMRWANAVGMKMVLLKPGKSDTFLKDGDEIVNTVPSIESQAAALTEFGPDPETQGLDSGQSTLDTAEFSDTARDLAKALREVRKDVGGIFTSTTDAVNTLLDRAELFEQMLDDYQVVTRTLGKRDRQIEQMLDNMVTLAGSFVDNRELVGDTLDEASKAMSSVDQILSGHGKDLDRIFGGARDFMDIIHDHRHELLKFWETYPQLFQSAFQIVNKGEYAYGTGVCGYAGPPPCPYPMNLPWGEVPKEWYPPFFPAPPEGWVPIEEGAGKQGPEPAPPEGSTGSAKSGSGKSSGKSAASAPRMQDVDSSGDLRRLLIGGR